MARGVLPGGPPESLTEQRADIVVFACGDPAHGEHDSVAIAACTGLPPEELERIDLKLVGPMRPEYLSDLAPGTHVIVADTIIGASGQISRIPLIEMSGYEEPLPATSTPDPPLDEVVAMAQLLRERPVTGFFIGLGVKSVDLTAPPPEDQVEAMRAAVEMAVAELDVP